MSLYSVAEVIRSSTENIKSYKRHFKTWQNDILLDNIDRKGRTSLVLRLFNSTQITGQIDRVRAEWDPSSGTDPGFLERGSYV